ncbi:MAG: NAD(P)H-dependent oxidoreductase subunit E, partial [Candidatus Methylomirabilis sp.]
MIVEELTALQHRLGFLSAEELRALSARIDVPLYRLYAVASFFPHFRLTPPVPVEVRVCADMSCHLYGASRLQRSLEATAKQMGAETVDVKEVSCLGQCDGAPAASINDQIYGSMTEQAMRSLIASAVAGKPLPRLRTVASSRSLCSDPYLDGRRFEALRRLVQIRDFAGTIAALKASDLRGMGGAGFPTWLKWDLVRNASGDEKYIVCNADESEPGTIKDREIMQVVPHLIIEGMVIAGLTVGARKGIFYIRHEYDLEREIIEQALDAAQREGVIGKA